MPLIERKIAAGIFDVRIALLLKEILQSQIEAYDKIEVGLSVSKLQKGMIVSRDIRTATGILIIPEGSVLETDKLERLISFERQKLIPSIVYVYQNLEQ